MEINWKRFSIIKDNSNKNDNNNFVVKMEKCLQNNINECFQKQQFGELPISTIHRIVNGCDKKLISHDELYDFISKSKNDRYPLYPFLCLQNLSDSKFNEFYYDFENENENNSSKNAYYFFSSSNITYLKVLKYEIKKLLKEKNEIKKQLSDAVQRNSELNNQIININSVKSQIQSQVDDLNNENSQLQNQMKILELKSSIHF